MLLLVVTHCAGVDEEKKLKRRREKENEEGKSGLRLQSFGELCEVRGGESTDSHPNRCIEWSASSKRCITRACQRKVGVAIAQAQASQCRSKLELQQLHLQAAPSDPPPKAATSSL